MSKLDLLKFLESYDGEVELAMQSGVKPVTLGKRILRTETAGMFVMAAVGLLLES